MKSICEINNAGTKRWYMNHHLHKEDGPAIEYSDGDKEWFLNGLRHREDGPAIEYGYKDKFWFYHGKQIDCKDNQEFLRMIKLMAFL